MMELLTDLVELPALASETRLTPCKAYALYERCTETLNGSLNRVKVGEGLIALEHVRRFSAQETEKSGEIPACGKQASPRSG